MTRPRSLLLLGLVVAGLAACLPSPAPSGWTDISMPGRVSAQAIRPVVLPNGKALIALGYGGPSPLYDPATGIWTFTQGKMAIERFNHTVTLLPNGKVLALGGRVSGPRPDQPPPTYTAELYDPATDTWTRLGPMDAITPHDATLLPNGKVLVTEAPRFAKWYEPTTDTWSTCPEDRVSSAHRAVLLPSGKMLFIGGFEGRESLLYDPGTDHWASGFRPVPGEPDAALLLSSGRVLVTWRTKDSTSPKSASLYDPESDVWSPTGSMNDQRIIHDMVLLRDGKVLAAGGAYVITAPSSGPGTTEIYDPATGIWTRAGIVTNKGYPVSLTLLPNGRVLCTGTDFEMSLYTPP